MNTRSTVTVGKLGLSSIVALALVFPAAGVAGPEGPGHSHGGEPTAAPPVVEQISAGGDDPSVVLPLGVMIGLLALAGGLVALRDLRVGADQSRRVDAGGLAPAASGGRPDSGSAAAGSAG